MVFSEGLVVFPCEEDSLFAILQSRVHEVWVRFFASSLEERLRYSPSDCFETFPLPENWRTDAALETAGRACNEFRRELMKGKKQGLTKTYNRFHDRMAHSADIQELQRLHGEMDRAVLHAYGWDGIDTTCDFLPDRPIEDDDTKVPWRYRWSDDVRDDVLARLLVLNQERPGTGAARTGQDENEEGDEEDGE